MRDLWCRFTAALLLSMACVGVAPHVCAQSAADVATARELFKDAAKLSREQKWEEARKLLERSLALKSAPITHYSLAVTQKHTGRLVEALENFRAFLASPPQAQTDDYRQPAATAVAELQSQVASASLVVRPQDLADLEVSIDGVVVPRAALDRPRLVNPGKHVVKATADAHMAAMQHFEVGPGGRIEVAITLTPLPAASGEPPRATIDAREPSLVLPATLLAAGGAALVVGIAVGMVGLAEARDAPTSDGPEADRARAKGIAGDTVATIGGAAAAVGLILLIVELTGNDEPAVGAARAWSEGGAAGVALRF